MAVIDIKLLPTKEAQEYESLWDTARFLFQNLDDQMIARIVSIAVNVCGHCHESATPCACTWDE